MLMIRVRAQARFRRYYYHALRNGKPSEVASDEAYARMVKDMQQVIDDDTSIDEFRKREIWGEIIAAVRDWMMLLSDVVPTATPEVLGKKVEALDKYEEAERLKDCQKEQTGDRSTLGVRSGDTDGSGWPPNGPKYRPGEAQEDQDPDDHSGGRGAIQALPSDDGEAGQENKLA